MGNQAIAGCCNGGGDEGGYVLNLDISNMASALAMAESSTNNGPRSLDAFYKEWDSIRAALKQRDVLLVRGSWLEEVCKRGQTLPRRQELPSEATWSPEELMAAMKDHNKQTPQLLSISYSWLSRDHPDPDGFHLRTFVPLLRHYARHCKIGTESLAIFIDWCSMHQAPRNQVEEASYQRGLRTVDVWYAHWNVETWLLTRTPDGVAGFEERGWTRFERALATLTKPAESTLDLGLLKGGWKNWSQVASDCQAERRVPETPENFATALASRKFSVREDEHLVSSLYREAFTRALSHEAQLWYAGLGWGDKEAQDLAQLLKAGSHSLRDLELRGNEIGNAGAAALAEAIPYCHGLERLSLDGNCIDRETQQALSDAWQRCAKPRFGLELGEQTAGPSQPRADAAPPARDLGAGGRLGLGLALGAGETPRAGGFSGLTTPLGSAATGNEQMNQLLARQAAFEARIESSVARLTDGLVEVADAVSGPQPQQPQQQQLQQQQQQLLLLQQQRSPTADRSPFSTSPSKRGASFSGFKGGESPLGKENRGGASGSNSALSTNASNAMSSYGGGSASGGSGGGMMVPKRLLGTAS